MADGKGDVQLSWQTVASGVSMIGLLAFAQWTVTQTQFSGDSKRLDELRDRVIILEKQNTDIIHNLAHDPVESKTFDAVNKANEEKIALLQNVINDLNRQVAAVVFGPNKQITSPPP